MQREQGLYTDVCLYMFANHIATMCVHMCIMPSTNMQLLTTLRSTTTMKQPQPQLHRSP